MLTLLIMFLVIAILAAVWGFSGVASASLIIVQTLFYLFLVMFAITLIVGLARKPRL